MGPPKRMLFHRHDNVELNYVTAGALLYFHCGKIYKIPKGQMLLFWASYPHVLIDVAPETQLYCIDIPTSLFLSWNLGADFFGRLLKGDMMVDEECSETVDSARIAQWYSDLASGNNSNADIISMELHARMQRMERSSNSAVGSEQSSRVNEKALSMAAYISQNFRGVICMTDIAAAAGLHTVSASRLFRKSFQETATDFIARCRIAFAIGLLASTNRTVLDIALDSGFGSAPNFYKTFQRRTGKKPSDFRNN